MEPKISIITLGIADLARSHHFFHWGPGFPTSVGPHADIAFFRTGGTCLALYPLDKLADDVATVRSANRGDFPGITLAHNTRSREDVDKVLALAEQASGNIEKPAQDAFWGGYSGYFPDPDGYLWEVAYADNW